MRCCSPSLRPRSLPSAPSATARHGFVRALRRYYEARPTPHLFPDGVPHKVPVVARNRAAMASQMRSLKFRRLPFVRDEVFDRGRASAPRMTAPHMLPSALSTASASANCAFRGSIAHPTQSLCTLRDGRHLPPRNTRYQAGATPYLGWTSTSWNASASWRSDSAFFFTPLAPTRLHSSLLIECTVTVMYTVMYLMLCHVMLPTPGVGTDHQRRPYEADRQGASGGHSELGAFRGNCSADHRAISGSDITSLRGIVVAMGQSQAHCSLWPVAGWFVAYMAIQVLYGGLTPVDRFHSIISHPFICGLPSSARRRRTLDAAANQNGLELSVPMDPAVCRYFRIRGSIRLCSMGYVPHARTCSFRSTVFPRYLHAIGEAKGWR